MARDPNSLVDDRYRLGDILGEGGFGAVYAGVDTQLRRSVAVKLLDPESAARGEEQARKLRRRFRREAIATAAIDHPNVVTVYDVGIADEGDVYIVMELLEGRPLGAELHRLPHGLEPARALPHFVDCLDALGMGHAAGIVHKDLKPSNLFLVNPASDGESMRIIDFGVARVLHEQKLTATGRIVGTPRYLAPEYIEEHQVTPALDVYQMALILVEALSGMSCVPRDLDLVACCERHLAGELRLPPGLRRGEIGEVLRRATERDPADRFDDGAEFSRALAQVDPASVKLELRGDRRPTPRLGMVKVQRSDGTEAQVTAPMYRAVTASHTEDRAQATEDTVRVGHDAEPNRDEGEPPPASSGGLRVTAGLIYALIALAVVSVIGLAAFVLLGKPSPQRSKPSTGAGVVTETSPPVAGAREAAPLAEPDTVDKEETTARADEEPTDGPDEETTARPDEKPADGPNEKPADGPNEKPADEPNEKPAATEQPRADRKPPDQLEPDHPEPPKEKAAVQARGDAEGPDAEAAAPSQDEADTSADAGMLILE